ncbi:hypothetical protein D3C72_2448230 [compost metagenome]
MAHTKSVVFTFTDFWEATNAVQQTVGMKYRFSSRQYFMSVSLMAYIPYQLVVWRIQHVVQGNR